MSLVNIGSLEGCKILSAKSFADNRGLFSELFRESDFLKFSFVQDNFSHSLYKGTFRGLHFQRAPFEQSKLVHVITGSILDFFVDLRPHSETFLDYCSYTLNSSDNESLLIPKGFAHGFLTLEDDTRVLYKVDNYYSPDHDFSLHWNDPSIKIDLQGNEVVHLSKKDDAGISITEINNRNLLNG